MKVNKKNKKCICRNIQDTDNIKIDLSGLTLGIYFATTKEWSTRFFESELNNLAAKSSEFSAELFFTRKLQHGAL